MPRKAKRLDNLRFGRLVVVQKVIRPSGRNSYWKCLCDCGKEIEVVAYSLTGGTTKSCGCLKREMKIKHGYRVKGRSHPLYTSWINMRQRCLNPNNPRFKDYGGRGITIDPRWESFESFVEDVGERPPGASLDRINVNGNYSPDNCRWASSKEQTINRRVRVVSPEEESILQLFQKALHFHFTTETEQVSINEKQALEKTGNKKKARR